MSFKSIYGLGVGSASNRNAYQEYILGGEGGRCLGLTPLLPSFTNCLEVWVLSLLGALGSVQASTGIDLTLPF